MGRGLRWDIRTTLPPIYGGHAHAPGGGGYWGLGGVCMHVVHMIVGGRVWRVQDAGTCGTVQRFGAWALLYSRNLRPCVALTLHGL